MAWQMVDVATCEALGLDPGEAVAENVTLAPDDGEIKELAGRFGKDFMAELRAELEKGVA